MTQKCCKDSVVMVLIIRFAGRGMVQRSAKSGHTFLLEMKA